VLAIFISGESTTGELRVYGIFIESFVVKQRAGDGGLL
jgi:hypothetical protein